MNTYLTKKSPFRFYGAKKLDKKDWMMYVSARKDFPEARGCLFNCKMEMNFETSLKRSSEENCLTVWDFCSTNMAWVGMGGSFTSSLLSDLSMNFFQSVLAFLRLKFIILLYKYDLYCMNCGYLLPFFVLYVELTGCCRRFLSLFTLPYPFVLRCWMWFDALIRRPPKWHFVIFVTFFNMTPKLYQTI